MPYDIHVRTADGGVQYPNAFSYGVEDGILRVQVGEDLDHSDQIYFAPGYWQQYVVDPHDEDPLDLGLLDDEDLEDEDVDDEYFDDEDLADDEVLADGDDE
ncbi:MAG: hypothetical protein JOY55_19410 [Mycobacterium sp.]|nr:hypothetical protein [Mycobacterium sp.]